MPKVTLAVKGCKVSKDGRCCGEKCRWLDNILAVPHCYLFFKKDKDGNCDDPVTKLKTDKEEPIRLPACIAAEKRAKGLK